MSNTGFYGSNIVNAEWWKDVIQDYLRNMLIGTEIANTKCESHLVSGDTVHFPQVSDVYVQTYTPGTDLSITPLTASDSALTVDQSKAATFSVDPVEVKQATSKYVSTVTYQAAYDLKNNIDQHIISTGITSASTNTTAFSTLTSNNIQNLFTDRYAQLNYNNAFGAERFVVVDPDRIALLTQAFVANGFQLADSTLRNGFVGSAWGFHAYESNNLPFTITLTMDTTPTAGDTLTIYGTTWTYRANGTAAVAGDISLGTGGTALADTQVSTRQALNGTGTAGASNYIDVSTEARRNYQNRQLTVSAFAADVATITGYGKMSPSETFTATTNIFGTETTKLLFGTEGAISLAIQMRPELYIHPEPKQLGMNYMTHTLFGDKVFSRDTKRVTTATINA